MKIKLRWLVLGAFLFFVAGGIAGWFGGYNLGWKVRDYSAIRELIQRDAALDRIRGDLWDLGKRMEVLDAGLVGLIRRQEDQLGITGRVSEAD